MSKHKTLIIILLMLISFPCAAFSWGDKKPTAIVIDNATGQPIEGAIALAQFYRSAPGGFFEGGLLVLTKAQETYSDKDGRIDLPDYWDTRNSFWKSSPAPRLTIYKPGYVLWDSQEICPFGKRTDFDTKHRTVKLLKFETEAARWLKEKYDVGRSLPRSMHNLFFSSCYASEINRKYSRQERKFEDIFYKYEKPLIDKEEMDRRAKEKNLR